MQSSDEIAPVSDTELSENGVQVDFDPLIVPSVTPSERAIALFESPSAASRATSASRGVRLSVIMRGICAADRRRRCDGGHRQQPAKQLFDPKTNAQRRLSRRRAFCYLIFAQRGCLSG